MSKKEKAISLRKEGKTLTEIRRAVGAPKTTVWGWIKEVEVPPGHVDSIKSFDKNPNRQRAQQIATKAMVLKYEKLKNEAVERGRFRVQHLAVLPEGFLAGILLYWAEGKKSGNLIFSNSDPEMIRVYVRFLIEHMHFSIEKIRIQLCFYDNEKTKDEIEDFWMGVVGVKRGQVYKSQVNQKPQEKAGAKIGRLPYGVCAVIVNSSYANYEMKGMIQEVSKRLGA